MSAGAIHANENGLSLRLDSLWEIPEAESLCHLASLGQFSLVDVLVVTGFSQSIFRLGVFEHLDSLGIVWFIEFFSQASKNVSHLFDVDRAPFDISLSLLVFKFDEVNFDLFPPELCEDIKSTKSLFFGGFLELADVLLKALLLFENICYAELVSQHT